MSAAIKLALDIALQAALVTLFAGSLFALVVGVSLMLGQGWVFRLNEYMNRWVSIRGGTGVLELKNGTGAALERMNYSPDRWIAASPKWLGGMITLGSLYAAAVLGYLFWNGSIKP